MSLRDEWTDSGTISENGQIQHTSKRPLCLSASLRDSTPNAAHGRIHHVPKGVNR
jgi:hypothetical protein